MAPKKSKSSRRRHSGGTSEIQGRAGESLPAREKALVGKSEEWEREDDSASQSNPGQPPEKVIEIEYESGPGSRFQREGRGIPRK